jgi:hypothetical protein
LRSKKCVECTKFLGESVTNSLVVGIWLDLLPPVVTEAIVLNLEELALVVV